MSMTLLHILPPSRSVRVRMCFGTMPRMPGSRWFGPNLCPAEVSSKPGEAASPGSDWAKALAGDRASRPARGGKPRPGRLPGRPRADPQWLRPWHEGC